jgi:hypothetical protein
MIICGALCFAGFYNGYCEDSASSGVIVIGPSGESPAETKTPQLISSGDEDPFEPAADSPAAAPFYEMSGNRIGSTQVSREVTLPSAGEIVFVDAGMTGAFTIVRVDQAGKETQVLSMNPERAVGHKLAKGTYKVYPEDFDGGFPSDKLSVKVQVKLIENTTGGAQ